MAITATVRRRVDEDHVSVAIPSYNFPHSIRDSSKVKRGQQIELTGEVTRIDDRDGDDRSGSAGDVDIGVVRLVEKYRAPKRRTPLRDNVG